MKHTICVRHLGFEYYVVLSSRSRALAIEEWRKGRMRTIWRVWQGPLSVPLRMVVAKAREQLRASCPGFPRMMA